MTGRELMTAGEIASKLEQLWTEHARVARNICELLKRLDRESDTAKRRLSSNRSLAEGQHSAAPCHLESLTLVVDPEPPQKNHRDLDHLEPANRGFSGVRGINQRRMLYDVNAIQ
jgi:hypothetical protein